MVSRNVQKTQRFGVARCFVSLAHYKIGSAIPYSCKSPYHHAANEGQDGVEKCRASRISKTFWQGEQGYWRLASYLRDVLLELLRSWRVSYYASYWTVGYEGKREGIC